MNRNKKFLTISLLILASVFLSACSGAFQASSWPGLTYDQDNNLVYVAYNQAIHALQAENGVELWRYPAEASNSVAFFASPKLDSQGMLIVGNYDDQLASIDPTNNGRQNWLFEDAGDRFIASPASSGGNIFAANADGNLYALSESGALQWTFESNDAIWSTPATDSASVFVASMDKKLYSVDQSTGRLNWETDLSGTSVSDLAIDENGTVFLGTFTQDLLAVNGSNGRVQWTSTTDGWIWGGATLDQGVLYVGDIDGTLYAFDSSNGRELWRVAAGGAITGSPLIANEHVYIGTENGQVVSVDLDGRIQWTQTFTGQAYGSPVQAGDLLLFGFVDGDTLINALDLNGNIVWSFVPQN